jgi:hypothetical protein
MWVHQHGTRAYSVEVHKCKHVPLLFVHLLKGRSDVLTADLFCILELDEFISAMASHIDQDVTSICCAHTIAAARD